MKYLLVVGILALLIFAPAAAAQSSRINTVDPETGKAGDLIAANGEGMDKTRVVELYLTDGTTDFKVHIMEQSDTVIKFKVPAAVKPGRWALMIKTGGDQPRLLEQPVKITVE